MSAHYTPKTLTRNPGYIYVIACGDYQKIGQSDNPMRRMIRMRTDNPYPLRLLVVLSTRDMDLAEMYLHQRYAAYHHDGEWYKIPAESLAWILTITDLDGEVENLLLDVVTLPQRTFTQEDIATIQRLRALGWRKTRILREAFDCQRGGSARYQTLSAAFDEVFGARMLARTRAR